MKTPRRASVHCRVRVSRCFQLEQHASLQAQCVGSQDKQYASVQVQNTGFTFKMLTLFVCIHISVSITKQNVLMTLNCMCWLFFTLFFSHTQQTTYIYGGVGDKVHIYSLSSQWLASYLTCISRERIKSTYAQYNNLASSSHTEHSLWTDSRVLSLV